MGVASSRDTSSDYRVGLYSTVVRCTPYWPGSPRLQRARGTATCEVCKWIFRTCSKRPAALSSETERHGHEGRPFKVSPSLPPPPLFPLAFSRKKNPARSPSFTAPLPFYRETENAPVSQVRNVGETARCFLRLEFTKAPAERRNKTTDRAASWARIAV